MEKEKQISNTKTYNKKGEYKDIIVMIIVLLFLIAGLWMGYFFTHSQTAHKYSKAAINVLQDYKAAKITSERAGEELNSLSIKARKEHEEKNDTSLYLVSIKLDNIVTKIKQKALDRLDIKDYIEELKRF